VETTTEHAEGKARKPNLDEDYPPIEISIIDGTHPVVATVSPQAHSLYIRLLGFCWRHRWEDIPEVYCDARILQNALGLARTNRRSFVRHLYELHQSNAIKISSFGNARDFYPTNVRQLTSIHVAGLRLKWPHRRLNRTEQNKQNKQAASSSTPPVLDALSEKPQKQKDREDFFEHWRAEYLADRKIKYVDIPGDAKAIPKLIQASGGLAEACRLASLFIRGPDEWQRANTTIRVMQSRINALREGNGNGTDNAIDRARRQLVGSTNAG
jgi:hypothetical protein